ncbi:MAG: hypothetical protein LBH60_06355 [Prevotellaceae bacterium]|jgi:3-hydroxyacyl-[acyl-carrier-protein] dehydratase|nr:hypothetical protein [Prevotellaceae bacterium]
MKLKDNFFKILNIAAYPDRTEYSVRLNSMHPVYMDHFPGNPVTPGVCIIQAVKELVEENIACPFFLQKIVKVRYFKAINPVNNAEITISVNISARESAYSISATVFSGAIIFSQLSIVLNTQVTHKE